MSEQAAAAATDDTNAQAKTEDGKGTASTETTHWSTGVSEDLREGLDVYKTMDDFVKEHKSAIGKLPIVPEGPDKYDIKIPDGAPKDEEFIGWARGVFHEAGLTQTQAAMVNDKWNTFVQAAMERNASEEKKVLEADFAALKKHWGSDFNKNKEAAEKMLHHLEGKIPGFKETIKENGISDSPLLTMILGTLGQLVSEDALVEGRATAPRSNEPDRIEGMPVLDFPSMRKKT